MEKQVILLHLSESLPSRQFPGGVVSAQSHWLDQRTATTPGQQDDDGQHQKAEEQKLRDTRCCTRETTKTEDRSQNGDQKEEQCPTQHDSVPFIVSVRNLSK